MFTTILKILINCNLVYSIIFSFELSRKSASTVAACYQQGQVHIFSVSCCTWVPRIDVLACMVGMKYSTLTNCLTFRVHGLLLSLKASKVEFWSRDNIVKETVEEQLRKVDHVVPKSSFVHNNRCTPSGIWITKMKRNLANLAGKYMHCTYKLVCMRQKPCFVNKNFHISNNIWKALPFKGYFFQTDTVRMRMLTNYV